MTSSYGYQRPLSNEEQLYLQNQALQAELQRREQEKPGDFIDTLGKTALAAGAVAGAVLGGRRLLGGKNTSATFDLSKFGEKAAEVRRAAAARVAPQEVVPPSRPVPTTSAERLQQIEEVTRQARAERPQGVVTVNLPQPKTARDPWTGRETITDPFGVGTVPTPVSRETARGTFLPQGRATTEELAARKKLLEDTELLKYVEAEEMAAANVLPENRAEQARQQAQVRRAYSALAEQARADLLAEQTETVAKAVNTSQAAAQSDFGPQQFIQDAGYVEADNLVDQYRGGAIGRIDQFANAANSAEDQATGRMKMALQRNEDNNLAAIEMAEDAVDAQIAKAAQNDPTVASVTELDSAINQVASTLPDGLPVDQAEVVTVPWGLSRSTGKEQTSASFSPRGFGFEPTQVGQALQKKALQARAAATPSDVSYIGRYPAVEETPPQIGRFPGSLGTSAGEAVVFTPATPGLTNVTRGGVEFTVQEGRLGDRPARVTVLPRGTTTEGINFPTPAAKVFSPEEAAAKLAEFEVSREAQIQSAMSKGLSEARAKRNVLITESQKQALESTLPSYSAEDVLSRSNVQSYGDVSEAERFAEEMASKTGRLSALEEGGFLEAQQDPGAIRTEPQQARIGSMISPASKTSYRGVTGRPGEGLYGLIPPIPSQQVAPGMSETFGPGSIKASKLTRTELGEGRGVTTPERFMPKISPEGRETPEGFVYTGTAMTQPSKLSQRELIAEAMQQATASPEGDVPIPPSIEKLTERQATPAAQRSLIASEALRRARIEGRDPQAVLRSLGFGV